MRGKRVKQLRHQFQMEHGRAPDRTQWSNVGRERLVAVERERTVKEMKRGRFPIMRVLWRLAAVAVEGTKRRWLTHQSRPSVVARQSAWRQYKREYKRCTAA